MFPRKHVCGAVDFYRMVIAVVMVAALVMTLSWLQGRYDASDHRKAVELVKDYHVKQGPTIPQVIAARHRAQVHDVSWTSELMSSCRGAVRVSGYLPPAPGREAATYAFDVLLTDPSIHPTDPATIEILRALTATTTSTVATSTSTRSLY